MRYKIIWCFIASSLNVVSPNNVATTDNSKTAKSVKTIQRTESARNNTYATNTNPFATMLPVTTYAQTLSQDPFVTFGSVIPLIDTQVEFTGSAPGNCPNNTGTLVGGALGSGPYGVVAVISYTVGPEPVYDMAIKYESVAGHFRGTIPFYRAYATSALLTNYPPSAPYPTVSYPPGGVPPNPPALVPNLQCFPPLKVLSVPSVILFYGGEAQTSYVFPALIQVPITDPLTGISSVAYRLQSEEELIDLIRDAFTALTGLQI